MTAITQTITSAPTPPSRTDPTTFADRSDAFVGYMEDVPVEYNALSSQVNVVASEITANANLALSQATIATNAALSASASANFRGNWTATAYTVPSSVFYNGSFWLANATTTSSDVPGVSSKWTRYDKNESQFNAKATSQALITTAATSGSTGIQVINDSNINLGTDNFSIIMQLALPDLTPTNNVRFIYKYSGSPTINLQYYINIYGYLILSFRNDAQLITLQSTAVLSSVISENTINEISVVVIRETESTSGSCTFYINGRQFGDTVTISESETFSIDNTGTLYLFGTGTVREAAQIKEFYLLKTALTENEVYNIYINGISGLSTALQLESHNLQKKQWLDSSINKLHAMLPSTGSNLKLSKNSFEIRWVNTWAGTHEAQYIGGFNQAILPVGCYIESIIGVVSGTTIEDIIIGDGSDADRWVAITTGLAAGTVSFTIANRISDGTNYKMIVDPDNAANMSISWVIKGIIL